MRIGHGFDVHRFTNGDHVMLGGVKIPHHRGILAHSDGDVLLHALCDALLGAASLGDIGKHFPPEEPQWQDISSMILLEQVYNLLRKQAYYLVNADLTLIAQSPYISDHVPAMREQVATALHCQQDTINVKATTPEKLGALGDEQGLAAHAVVLISKH